MIDDDIIMMTQHSKNGKNPAGIKNRVSGLTLNRVTCRLDGCEIFTDKICLKFKLIPNNSSPWQFPNW